MNEEAEKARVLAKLEEILQEEMNAIRVEWSLPLDRAVAMEKSVVMTGASEESRQMRLGRAIKRVLIDQMSPTGRRAAESGLSCFAVSMGIQADAWCKTTSIEYEPDCVFVPKGEAGRMPHAVFTAVSMVEIAWTNRPFLDSPAAIDPGRFFEKLQSYVMVDISRRRLLLFRRATHWQPEPCANRQMPARIDGLDFDIDWKRIYDEAGVDVAPVSGIRRFTRIVMSLLRHPDV